MSKPTPPASVESTALKRTVSTVSTTNSTMGEGGTRTPTRGAGGTTTPRGSITPRNGGGSNLPSPNPTTINIVTTNSGGPSPPIGPRKSLSNTSLNSGGKGNTGLGRKSSFLPSKRGVGSKKDGDEEDIDGLSTAGSVTMLQSTSDEATQEDETLSTLIPQIKEGVREATAILNREILDVITAFKEVTDVMKRTRCFNATDEMFSDWASRCDGLCVRIKDILYSHKLETSDALDPTIAKQAQRRQSLSSGGLQRKFASVVKAASGSGKGSGSPGGSGTPGMKGAKSRTSLPSIQHRPSTVNGSGGGTTATVAFDGEAGRVPRPPATSYFKHNNSTTYIALGGDGGAKLSQQAVSLANGLQVILDAASRNTKSEKAVLYVPFRGDNNDLMAISAIGYGPDTKIQDLRTRDQHSAPCLALETGMIIAVCRGHNPPREVAKTTLDELRDVMDKQAEEAEANSVSLRSISPGLNPNSLSGTHAPSTSSSRSPPPLKGPSAAILSADAAKLNGQSASRSSTAPKMGNSMSGGTSVGLADTNTFKESGKAALSGATKVLAHRAKYWSSLCVPIRRRANQKGCAVLQVINKNNGTSNYDQDDEHFMHGASLLIGALFERCDNYDLLAKLYDPKLAMPPVQELSQIGALAPRGSREQLIYHTWDTAHGKDVKMLLNNEKLATKLDDSTPLMRVADYILHLQEMWKQSVLTNMEYQRAHEERTNFVKKLVERVRRSEIKMEALRKLQYEKTVVKEDERPTQFLSAGHRSRLPSDVDEDIAQMMLLAGSGSSQKDPTTTSSGDHSTETSQRRQTVEVACSPIPPPPPEKHTTRGTTRNHRRAKGGDDSLGGSTAGDIDSEISGFYSENSPDLSPISTKEVGINTDPVTMPQPNTPQNPYAALSVDTGFGNSTSVPDAAALLRVHSLPRLSSGSNEHMMGSASTQAQSSGAATAAAAMAGSVNGARPSSTSLPPGTPNSALGRSVLSKPQAMVSMDKEQRKKFQEKEEGGKIKYKIGNVIGIGAHGKVHVALIEATGESVACKKVMFDMSNENELEEKLRSLQVEVNLLKALEHPNIVRYLFVDKLEEEQKGLGIFMEYVAGGSIAHMIKEFGALPERTVAIFTAQLLIGLSYLHEKGVAHRDVKPANCLVSPQGDVKLADFGTATLVDTPIPKGEGFEDIPQGHEGLCGTPFYMPPEVIRQEESKNPLQSDMWSLGTSVMEMLTGVPPFHHIGSQPVQVLRYVGGCTPETQVSIPENLSPDAHDFIRCCCNPVMEQRPTPAMMLLHPWFTKCEVLEEIFGDSGEEEENTTNPSAGGAAATPMVEGSEGAAENTEEDGRPREVEIADGGAVVVLSDSTLGASPTASSGATTSTSAGGRVLQLPTTASGDQGSPTPTAPLDATGGSTTPSSRLAGASTLPPNINNTSVLVGVDSAGPSPAARARGDSVVSLSWFSNNPSGAGSSLVVPTSSLNGKKIKVKKEAREEVAASAGILDRSLSMSNKGDSFVKQAVAATAATTPPAAVARRSDAEGSPGRGSELIDEVEGTRELSPRSQQE